MAMIALGGAESHILSTGGVQTCSCTGYETSVGQARNPSPSMAVPPPRLAVWAVVMSALGMAVGSLAAPNPAIELLTNGDCADGSLQPWSKMSGVAWTCCNTAADCGEALNGSHLFYPGTCSGPDCPGRNNPILQELLQVVDVSSMAVAIDAGTVSFSLTGSLRTHCGLDAAVLAMTYTDASGDVLATYRSCRYQDTVWGQSVIVQDAPARTRYARVHLIAEARRGTSADGYFDGLSLRACTTGSNCPAAVGLICPTMATAVASGPLFKQVVKECGGAVDSGELAGMEVLLARRTGYCTEACAAVWGQYWRELNRAKSPDCSEYQLVSTTLTREAGFVNRMCADPVPNSYQPAPDPVENNGAGTGRGAGAAVLAVVAAVTAVAAAVALR